MHRTIRAGLIAVAALTTAVSVASSQTRAEAEQKTQAQNAETAERLAQMRPTPQVSGARPVRMILVTSVGRISANPIAFAGTRVSVHADVEDVYSRHEFTLDQDDIWRPGEDLLVLIPRPSASAAAIDDDDFVTVIGTVRRFISADFERDYDWFDYDALPDLDIEFEGRPVLIAEMARTSDGALVTAMDESATRVLATTAGHIAELPARYFGSSIAVTADVEDVWSPRVFTLDEDAWFAGPDVLVFNPHPATDGADLEDRDVTVYGTVRPFITAEFEADYDWFDAAEYEPFELDDWDRRPVIVASSILAEGRDLVEFRPEFALDRAEAQLADNVATWRAASAADAGRGTRAQSGEEPRQATGTTGSSGTTGTTGQSPASDSAGAPESIQVTAYDYRFEPKELTVAPGEQVRIVLKNTAPHLHSIELHLAGSKEAALVSPVAAGASGSLVFTAPTTSGTYVFYCPVANHRERGMTGTLIVREQ